MTRPPLEVIVAIERECLVYDRVLAALDWDGCRTSFRAQRLLTHELEIAMRSIVRSSDEGRVLQARIDRVMRYRAGQIQRLQNLRARCTKRLTAIGNFRRFAKARGPIERGAMFLDLNS